MTLTSKLNRARKSRQFFPSSPADRAEILLERRRLTRPAVFGAAPAVRPADDQAQAAVFGLTGTQSAGSYNYAAAAWDDQVTAGPGGYYGTATFQQTAGVTSGIPDLANPGGQNPVGNYTVSMNVSHQHHQIITGSTSVQPPFNMVIKSIASGQRSYTLADDGTAPSRLPTTLVEHFVWTYIPPPRPVGILVMGATQVVTPGFTAVSTGPGAPQVTAIGGGTNVVLSNSVDPVTGIDTFSLTASTAFPAGLPLAVDPVTGASGGVPWRVNYGSELDTQIVGNDFTNTMETLNYHYDMQFQ